MLTFRWGGGCDGSYVDFKEWRYEGQVLGAVYTKQVIANGEQ